MIDTVPGTFICKVGRDRGERGWMRGWREREKEREGEEEERGEGGRWRVRRERIHNIVSVCV